MSTSTAIATKPDAGSADRGLDGLSPRELEVLRLLSDGMRSSEIADELGIAVPTVKCHLTRTYRKLGVRNRVGAVLHYLRSSAVAAD
jgi:DNA-binding CsgD family transcriptional regulator